MMQTLLHVRLVLYLFFFFFKLFSNNYLQCVCVCMDIF